MTTVLVCGAGGRMGREVVNAVWQDSELQLVGAVDVSNAGMPVAEIVNNDDCQVVIMDDLQAALEATSPDVVVDFTSPKMPKRRYGMEPISSSERPVSLLMNAMH